MPKAMACLAALAIGLLAGTHASAQELSKQAKIESILAVTNSNAMMDQMFNQIKSLTAQMPTDSSPEQRARMQEVQSKMMDLVKGVMDKVRPQFVKVYDETYTDEEINGIYAFYESPAGKAMVQKAPAMLSKVVGLMQTQMAEIMPQIQQMTREAATGKQ